MPLGNANDSFSGESETKEPSKRIGWLWFGWCLVMNSGLDETGGAKGKGVGRVKSSQVWSCLGRSLYQREVGLGAAKCMGYGVPEQELPA